MAKAVNPGKGVNRIELWHVVGTTWWANGNEGGIRSGTSICPD